MNLFSKKILITVCLPVCYSLNAQNVSDTTHSREEKNRNIMLNASDASKPREVSIGLPGSVGGTDIFEDGLPVVYYFWPHMAYTHWRGGVAYEKSPLMKLSETALTGGSVGYAINSFSRSGGEQFEGRIDYTANHFGMQKVDLNIAGPSAAAWAGLVAGRRYPAGIPSRSVFRENENPGVYLYPGSLE